MGRNNGIMQITQARTIVIPSRDRAEERVVSCQVIIAAAYRSRHVTLIVARRVHRSLPLVLVLYQITPFTCGAGLARCSWRIVKGLFIVHSCCLLFILYVVAGWCLKV